MKKIILVSLVCLSVPAYAQQTTVPVVIEVDAQSDEQDDLDDLFGEEHTEFEEIHSSLEAIHKTKPGIFAYARVALRFFYDRIASLVQGEQDGTEKI